MKYGCMIMFFEKYTDINKMLKTRIRINKIQSSNRITVDQSYNCHPERSRGILLLRFTEIL